MNSVSTCCPLVLRSLVDHHADEPVPERRQATLTGRSRLSREHARVIPKHPGIERFGEFPGSHDS